MGTVVAVVDAVGGFTGQKTVAAGGTPEKLTTTATGLSNGVYVRALAANNGKIYVGFLSSALAAVGYELSAGESVFLELKFANIVYIDASVNGEGVCFLAS